LPFDNFAFAGQKLNINKMAKSKTKFHSYHFVVT
jgi:hypothetical protein